MHPAKDEEESREYLGLTHSLTDTPAHPQHTNEERIPLLPVSIQRVSVKVSSFETYSLVPATPSHPHLHEMFISLMMPYIERAKETQIHRDRHAAHIRTAEKTHNRKTLMNMQH